jgi:hypothetical protein
MAFKHCHDLQVVAGQAYKTRWALAPDKSLVNSREGLKLSPFDGLFIHELKLVAIKTEINRTT